MQSLDQLVARFESQWNRFGRYSAALKRSELPAAEQNLRYERACLGLDAAAANIAAFPAVSITDMIQKARVAVRMGSALECDTEIAASIVRDLVSLDTDGHAQGNAAQNVRVGLTPH